MDLTSLTKKTGDIIAKIKNNNELIDLLNKKINPTFVDIIENLQKTDTTLCKMLMLWYMETYSVTEEELNEIIEMCTKNSIRKSNKKTVKRSTTVIDTSCGGSPRVWGYSSGCDSPYYPSSSGGCGCSSSSSGGC